MHFSDIRDIMIARNDGPCPKRAKLEDTKVSANAAIRFALLPPDATASAESGEEFEPDMSHQLFGEEESIVGHKNPSAKVVISSLTFESTVEFRSESQEPGASKVQEILEKNFGHGLLSSRSSLNESHRRDQGLDKSLLGSYTSQRDSISVHRYELRVAPDSVKTLHARAQQLLVFYVDGATPLDQDETDWDLLIAVKKLGDRYVLVGFCTLYRMYAYPSSSRLRVSQILVLPPYQKQGIGTMLLESAYTLTDAEGLQSIVYEDPTDEVQSLRERIEVKRATSLPWLTELAGRQGAGSLAMNGTAGSQPPATLALRPEDTARAQKELRLPKQQIRRLWEALLARQPPFQQEPGIFALRGLVARRIFGSFADTKQQAVEKQIFTFDKLGSFLMCKVPRAEGIKGMPVALEDDEGQSKEEQLEEAVEQRMDALLQQSKSHELKA